MTKCGFTVGTTGVEVMFSAGKGRSWGEPATRRIAVFVFVFFEGDEGSVMRGRHSPLGFPSSSQQVASSPPPVVLPALGGAEP